MLQLLVLKPCEAMESCEIGLSELGCLEGLGVVPYRLAFERANDVTTRNDADQTVLLVNHWKALVAGFHHQL